MVCSKIREIFRPVFFYLYPYRKNIVLKNLELCYPGKPEEWRINILKEAYNNISIILFEILYLKKLSEKDIREYIHYDYEEIFENAYNKGKGIILISAHYSNWELAAYGLRFLLGRPINILVKHQSNSGVNNEINRIRELHGNKVIELGASLRQMFSMIKNNELVCFVIDQAADPRFSCFIDFFNVKTTAFNGPAKVALKYNSEILVGYMRRENDLKYTSELYRLDYSDINEYNEKNICELTQRIQSAYEEVIRKDPSQWLWFHRRFKSILKYDSEKNISYTDSLYR